MSERVLNLAQGLGELRQRLDRAAAITVGAQLCAQRGAAQDAFQMILELDVDVLISEAQTLLAAISMRSMETHSSN